MGDEQGTVDWAHAQAGNVLDQELLHLLRVGEVVVDDDSGDCLDAEQTAGQRATLALDQQIIAWLVRRSPHSDRRQDAELLNRSAELLVAVTVALPGQAFLGTNALDSDILDPQFSDDGDLTIDQGVVVAVLIPPRPSDDRISSESHRCHSSSTADVRGGAWTLPLAVLRRQGKSSTEYAEGV